MLRTRLKLNLAFATFSAMAVMPLSSRVLFAQAAPATRPYQSNEHVILHRSEPNGVMKGFPPDKRQLVTLDNWESALGDSLLTGKGSSKELPKFRWSLRHMREIFPTQVIRRGPGPVSVFPVRRIAMDLDELRFEDVRGNERSVKEWLEYSNTDAILVVHKGAIVYEEYFDGMTEDTTHRIHSGSKSISATVIANLIAAKQLTLNGMITDSIPELRGTGYDGATVRHCLDMRSGVGWSYEAPGDKNTYTRWTQALGVHRILPVVAHHEGLYSALTTFPDFDKNHSRPHGGYLNYKESDSRVLAWAAEKETKTRFADLLSKHIWSKLGTEHDAEVLCDGLGSADTSDGIALTLRDFGRWGQMLLNGGRFNDRQIVPRTFIDDIVNNFDVDAITNESFPGPRHNLGEEVRYRNQFWVYEHEDSVDFAAAGSSGQFCYLSPKREAVIVKFSTHPPPSKTEDMMFFTRGDEGAIAAICNFLMKHTEDTHAIGSSMCPSPTSR